jgi:hypothetical protein
MSRRATGADEDVRVSADDDVDAGLGEGSGRGIAGHRSGQETRSVP